jgi:PAS domain S-box-containing protein
MSLNLPENSNSSQQQEVLDALPVLVFLERAGQIVFANAEARQMLGVAEAKWTHRPVEDVLWGLFPGTAEPQTSLTGSRQASPFHATLAGKGGKLMPVEGTYSILNPRSQEAVIIAQAGGRERVPRPRLMEDVLASIPEAVAIVHGAHVLYTNPSFTRMFGFTAEEVSGGSLRDFIVPETREHENAMMQRVLHEQGRAKIETVRKTKGGELIDVAIQVAPLIVAGDNAGYVLTYRDIDERKQVEARQQHHAMHDAVTGLPNREFELWYQPIYRLATGQVDGFEALRWRRADGTIERFGDLLPVAEDVGLSVGIEHDAIEIVCRQLQSWSGAIPGSTFSLTVNITHRQFYQDDLVAHLKKTLAATGVDPSRLMFEVSETTLNDNPDTALAVMQRLVDCGVRVALDNFGSSLAPLNHLVRLPIAVVKMDPKLTVAATTAGRQLALVESLIHVGKSVGVQVLAQGIETAEQLTALRHLGCELGQGHLLSHALEPSRAQQLASQGAAQFCSMSKENQRPGPGIFGVR